MGGTADSVMLRFLECARGTGACRGSASAEPPRGTSDRPPPGVSPGPDAGWEHRPTGKRVVLSRKPQEPKLQEKVTLGCRLCIGPGVTMEFPDLGKHCSERSCKQLDFLPITCDACKQDFCKDHFSYAAHQCPMAFKKDVHVPVCPLCNVPVPVRRGEIPDVVVGEHMDRDCTRHPERRSEKVFTHRCSKDNCRKKEMVPLPCAQCRGNFCIQHRHPLDHNCRAGGHSASRAGASATRAPEPKLSGALNALSSGWLAQQLRWKVKR